MDRNDQIFVAALIALMLTIVLSVVVVSTEGATTAAWVQAIGVIAALGVTIYVALWQHRRTIERDQRLADDTVDARIRDATGLVFKALTAVNTLPSWALLAREYKLKVRDTMPEQLRGLLYLIDKLDFLGLPDFTMTSLLADLRAKLARIVGLMGERTEILSGLDALVRAGRLASIGEIAIAAREDCEDFIRVAQEYHLRGGPPESSDVD